MPSISETIARLASARSAAGMTIGHMPQGGDRLSILNDFGSNPGDLDARIYLPEGLPPGAPLVVVLHGCGQRAASYDHGSGWSTLADRHGFALLFPEQRVANNPNRCFNWFLPEDTRRGSGEALSIREMIAKLVNQADLDPTRIFVTGLSAGGAMTSVMLATYPDVFAGGSIIAGLPYGSAVGVPQALERMRGQGGPGEAALTALVRSASPHEGPWPIISVWHGSRDATVAPTNADAIVAQWRGLHAVGAGAGRREAIDGHQRSVWSDHDGRDVIEEYRIAGMGHGTPLDTKAVDGCGASGPYMLDMAISSTRHIAEFWGLAVATERKVDAQLSRSLDARAEPETTTAPFAPSNPVLDTSAGVSAVIEKALRSAGLMR